MNGAPDDKFLLRSAHEGALQTAIICAHFATLDHGNDFAKVLDEVSRHLVETGEIHSRRRAADQNKRGADHTEVIQGFLAAYEVYLSAAKSARELRERYCDNSTKVRT